MVRYAYSHLALLITSMLWLLPLQAEILNIGDAINKAGAQRMLTQRIVKDYCLVALDVKTNKYLQEIADSVNRFDSVLKDLKAFSSTDGVKNALTQVDKLWKTVKRDATSKPQVGKVEKFRANAEKLLKASHQVVASLAKLSTSKAGHLTNISGRQRMLSQRMASLYMIAALGLQDQQYKQELEHATMEFKLALTELEGSDHNTPAIKAGLKEVKTQFSLFEFSVKKESDTHFPFVVSEAADKILTKMDKITQLYSASAK